MDGIFYYIIHFACTRLKARCSVPRNHRKIIFRPEIENMGYGMGRERMKTNLLLLR